MCIIFFSLLETMHLHIRQFHVFIALTNSHLALLFWWRLWDTAEISRIKILKDSVSGIWMKEYLFYAQEKCNASRDRENIVGQWASFHCGFTKCCIQVPLLWPRDLITLITGGTVDCVNDIVRSTGADYGRSVAFIQDVSKNVR